MLPLKSDFVKKEYSARKKLACKFENGVSRNCVSLKKRKWKAKKARCMNRKGEYLCPGSKGQESSDISRCSAKEKTQLLSLLKVTLPKIAQIHCT